MYMNYFIIFEIEMKQCVFALPIGFPYRDSAFHTDMSIRLYLQCISDSAILYPVPTRIS